MRMRIAIEWTRATLRVALAEGREARCRIRAIHSQPLGTTGGLGAAVRALLKSTKTGAADVIGVVPREQVITRLVTFPATDSGELAQMVELYARAQLPYPREQTVTDFHVLRQQEGFSTVAIIACQREVVERYAAPLREAGLAPGLLTPSSWGVLGWYQRLLRSDAGQRLRAGQASEPVLIINVDDTRTDLVLVGEGRVLSSRSIGQGAQDWAALSETAELLVLEVERTQAAIRKELPGVEVRSIMLTGLGEVTVWSERLSQRLSLPVLVVDATEPLGRWTGAMATPISPVVVGGLACSEPCGLLDLSPPEVRASMRHHQQIRDLVTVGVLLMGVLALGSGILAFQTVRERRLAFRLDQVLTEIEPVTQQVREKTRSAQVVDSLLENRRRLAANLSGVFRITPPGVTLEGLTFERARRELVLRGNAASTQTVLDYIKQLERLDGVGGVELKYSTRRSGPSGERTDFELVLRQGDVS